ncbi:MAG TPA: M1 family aminopeptidase, partial [Saprospiraceae bacterium]|nr:M1 family aminopeptidase [Saprospiraceae bacterium]
MILRNYLLGLFVITSLAYTTTGLCQTPPVMRNFAAAETDVHYQDMQVEIDPAINKVAGVVTFYFTSRIDQLNRFVVDYQDDLPIVSISRGNTPLSFSRSDDLITIDLGKSLLIGEQDTLSISYESEGTLKQEMHSGKPVVSTDLDLGVLWYPGKRDLTDKIDSVDVYVTTPPNQYVAGNGTLEGIEEINDKWIHHWQHRHPIATTYLLELAITNYTIVKDSVLLRDGTMLPLYHYLYPESVAALSAELAATPDILQFFENHFGAYPFADEKYGHAQYTAGGALEVQTMSFMGFFNFEVIAHEMAHQWFGDNVTFGSWTDIWMSEGMAEYLSGLAVEALRPTEWNGVKTSKINSITSQPGGSVYVTDTTDLSVIFDGRLTYNKGFYLAHMLRWMVGDTAFFQACRNYLQD